MEGPSRPPRRRTGLALGERAEGFGRAMCGRGVARTYGLMCTQMRSGPGKWHLDSDGPPLRTPCEIHQEEVCLKETHEAESPPVPYLEGSLFLLFLLFLTEFENYAYK